MGQIGRTKRSRRHRRTDEATDEALRYLRAVVAEWAPQLGTVDEVTASNAALECVRCEARFKDRSDFHVTFAYVAGVESYGIKSVPFQELDRVARKGDDDPELWVSGLAEGFWQENAPPDR